MAEPVTTPGVYINEEDAFANSIVGVATAVPAFIGHTETAMSDNVDLTNVPVRIESMDQFQALYSSAATGPQVPGAPALEGTIDFVTGSKTELTTTNTYLLFRSLQLFYANGGGLCWIVSVGSYDTKKDPISASSITDAIEALKNEPEPTIIVTPDAVNLSESDWSKVTTAAIDHCQTMQSRVTIIDIHGGDQQPTATNDPIENFRNALSAPAGPRPLSYAMAYWPWLNTSIIESAELNYTALSAAVRAELAAEITAEATANAQPAAPAAALTDAISLVKSGPATSAHATHEMMNSASAVYTSYMSHALTAANLMPPSSAMAGIYTAVDNSVGVWKAPANVTVQSVISPFVNISEEDQGSMNLPLDGLAVNAIRTFPGLGILVWGARTLDGNSEDWRYINVQRTMIMLEQSIKAACESFAFTPNTASTWTDVSVQITAYLDRLWEAGALQGTQADEAFQVNVGLGSTMTATDILDGLMRVTVKVAVTHPAEFMVLTIEQQMQTS